MASFPLQGIHRSKRLSLEMFLYGFYAYGFPEGIISMQKYSRSDWLMRSEYFLSF